MIKVAILGFGNLGQALAAVLSRRQPEVKISAWDVVETGDRRQTPSIARAVEGCQLILISVPSQNFEECLGSVGPISQENILVTFTKGFTASGLLPFEYLEKSYPENGAAVVSGPMLAEELSQNQPTAAVAASAKDGVGEKLVDLFRGTNLCLKVSADPVGVSLCGILKNIYALLLGLSDGLGMGSNFKAVLATLALVEMAQLLEGRGGQRETLWTTAGLGDFLTTGYSPKSRNYTYGYKKAKGENPAGILAEGVVNLDGLVESIRDWKNLTLLGGVRKVFLEDQDPRSVLSSDLLG